MSQDDRASLDDLLGDEPVHDVELEPVEKGEKVEAEPPSAQMQEEDPTRVDDEGDDGPPLVPRKGLIEERKKRQSLEQQVAELTKRLSSNGDLAQGQQQPPPQPEQQQPRPDPYEDPEGYAAAIQAENRRALFETKAAIGQELMRERFEDYDQVEEAFAAAARSNPQLVDAMVRSPNPAKYAYDTGKRILAFQEIGDDPASYRARLEAEILEKHGLSARPAEDKPARNPKAKAPTSLASVASAPPVRDSAGRYAPASLSDILDD